MCEENGDGGRGLLDKKRDEIFRRREGFRVSGRHCEGLYFGMIIVIIYGVLTSPDWWVVSNRLCVVLLVPVVYGCVAFVKMTSLKLQDSAFARKQEIIDDARISLDSESGNLDPAADKALAAVADKMSSDWSSPKGILKTATAFQGTKTIIGLLNCCFLTASVLVLGWPNSPVFACIQGLFVFLLGVSLHIFYALWRDLLDSTYWADSVQSQSPALKASFTKPSLAQPGKTD